MYQHTIKLLLLSLSLGMTASIVHAEDFVVIVHPSNDAQLNKSIVQRIFLSKEKAFTSGKEAIPVNIKAPAEEREAFERNIIDKNESQIRSYWSMVVFSGKGTPPKEVPDEKTVVELVATNPNVIGYVSSDQVTDKVKAVVPF